MLLKNKQIFSKHINVIKNIYDGAVPRVRIISVETTFLYDHKLIPRIKLGPYPFVFGD